MEIKRNPAVGSILAGGRGKRLSSIVPLYSKTLIEINGLPVVCYAARALALHVDEIILVTSPSNSTQVTEAVWKEIRNIPHISHIPGKKIDLINAIQPEPLGVADAIKTSLGKIREDRPLVVICGDNIVESIDIKNVLARVQDDESPRVKMAWTYKEFDAENARRFAVWAPPSTGAPGDVQGDGMLIEKPADPPSRICWCGPLAFRSSFDVSDRILRLSPSNRGEYEITDLLNTYLARGESGREQSKGIWFDIGTPQALEESKKFFMNDGDKK
jgi:glucose-1-phosphate thymidylyltransferase